MSAFGVKRTLCGRAAMSAFDPKRTLAGIREPALEVLDWLLSAC